MSRAAAALLFLLPAAAWAGAGTPPKPPGALDAVFSYCSPEGFISRRTELRGTSALGRAGGMAFRTETSLTHIRTIENGYFPPELYKTALLLTAEDRTTRLSVNLNSDSDKPFYSPAETDLGFNFSRTFSEHGAHAWIFVLNYSTRRTFARSVPLPFITYRYASKDLFFLFPFLARWQASRNLSFSASYHPVKYYKLSAHWRRSPEFSVVLEGGAGLEQFLPAGRPQKGSALYYETSFVSLKPELVLAERLRLGAALGWQFRGMYYTGRTYNDYQAKTRIGGGPCAGLSAGYSF